MRSCAKHLRILPRRSSTPHSKVIAFIDEHRVDHGVEPICRVLPIAPSTYHLHIAKHDDPSKLSLRAARDLFLKTEIERVVEANYDVFGVRKVWRQMQRKGFDVARRIVARLMGSLELHSAIRGKFASGSRSLSKASIESSRSNSPTLTSQQFHLAPP